MHRAQHHPDRLPCTVAGCLRWFKSHSGRTKHIRTFHAHPTTPSQSLLRRSSTPVFHDADGPIFDMPLDGMDYEGARGRSSSLPLPLDSAGSESSPLPSIGHRSLSPNNDTSMNYHPYLDGEFFPHPADQSTNTNQVPLVMKRVLI
jgi:hypothetical protein